jgi:hypothetical protein
MSVDAAIPDRFWPAVRWACTYVFSWILPLLAAEEFVAGRLPAGATLALLTLLDWLVAAKWDWIGEFTTRRRRPMALILISVAAVLFLAGLFLALGPKPKEAEPPTFVGSMVPAKEIPRNQLNLKAALQDELSPGAYRTTGDVPYKDKDGKIIEVQISEFNNPHDGARFLAAYIPATSSTVEIAKEIIGAHETILEKLAPSKDATRISAKGEYGSLVTDNVRFTGKIFIYHDQLLSTDEYSQIDEIAKTARVSVTLRDPRYLTR